MSPDYGLSVAEAFQKYLKTGDVSHIESYSAKQLRTAISRLSPYYDNNKMWYREIERRVDTLSTLEESKNQKLFELFKEKWLGKMISFGLGFLGGVIL